MEEENKVFGTGLYDEEQIEAFKQAFDLFDKDKGGSISNAELMAVMKSMGTPATKQEIDEMLAANDDDNDGEINFNEFINLMESRAKNPAKQDDTFAKPSNASIVDTMVKSLSMSSKVHLQTSSQTEPRKWLMCLRNSKTPRATSTTWK